MTSSLSDAALRPGGRVLAKPPSIFTTGARLPEVRWAALSLVLFLVAWPLQLAGAPVWLWWMLYLACYAAGGWAPARAGIQALREKTLDVDLLMIVAAIAAASIGQVFDGALLIVIFATSGALEALVTQQTADSVSSLLTLAPERSTRVVDHGHGDGFETVESSDLAVGDVILVRPGERIGADGTVIDGLSDVDQAAMTGESVPIRRVVGDAVLSGTTNATGALRIRVDRPASESVIARVVSLVESASATKAKTQLFIEKVEQRYSIGVVVATLIVFFLPLALGEEFQAALLRAITFMIVASPCAVVLSTMPPLLASIANAGRHGVLVKSATVMEQLGRTQLVAFDKTGTLTVGSPVVSDVHAFEPFVRHDLLRFAAALEVQSEHPLGQAIVRAAAHLNVPSATEFRALPGVGVEGVAGGQRIQVSQASTEHKDQVGTIVNVMIDTTSAGYIVLEDAIREDARTVVTQLKHLTSGPVHLLTGDNTVTAEAVSAHTGIDHVHSRLLPDGKAEIVRQLETNGKTVMVVGDGINDAPAMATASTGVAMGRHGSDLALDTADAVIIRDDLTSIPKMITLSRRAHRFVVANLIFAATFITVLVTWDLISILPLPLAVAGHEGSTVIVALNGLRLLRRNAWT